MSDPARRLSKHLAWRARRRWVIWSAALSGMLVWASTTLGVAPAMAEPYGVAVLRVLDTVTARVSTIRATIGQPVRFGTLAITVRTCDKRPPEETPEAAAFMDIQEARSGQTAETVFQGWMFASSRALSAMDHPVYDVWVLDCASVSSTADSSRSEDKSK